MAGARDYSEGGVIVSADSALVAFEGLVEEMNTRQEILRNFDARNISEANGRGRKTAANRCRSGRAW